MRKKVVHLTRLYFPHIGGVEKHLYEVDKILVARKYDVAVLTESTNAKLADSELINEVKIIRLHPRINKGLGYKLSLWQEILKKINYCLTADVIVIHDVFWWLIPFLPLLFFKKIYIVFHGYEGSNTPTRTQVFWHYMASKLTRGNICVGGFHQKWFHVKPNYTIYGAVDKFVTHKQPDSDHNIVFMGRLSEDAGILLYLSSLLILKNQHQLYHLDIFGDGPQLKEAKNFVKQHQLDVTFYGAVKPEEIDLSKYQIAFVSRYLAILEAMASNTKIIAHYNNDIKDDYLTLTPFAQWIKIVQTPEEIAQAVMTKSKIKPVATKWAQAQTWEQVAAVYQKLWQR